MHNTSVFILCLAVCFFLFLPSESTRQLKVIHFGKCENYHDTPMIANEKEIEINDGIHRSTVVELDLEKDIDDIEAKLSIYKCNEENGTKTCKYFWKDHELKDVCSKLTSNDVLVRFIIDSSTPKVTSCPMRKGLYETMFLNGQAFFHNFSLASGDWTVKWSIYDKEEMIICYECQVNINEE